MKKKVNCFASQSLAHCLGCDSHQIAAPSTPYLTGIGAGVKGGADFIV
jgi:hypothetical protein